VKPKNLTSRIKSTKKLKIMTIVIIILVIGGFIYLKGISEPDELKRLIQGRPPQQQDVIKYFWGKNSFPNTGF
jgi:predicted thioredoxin/glutaredoxin